MLHAVFEKELRDSLEHANAAVITEYAQIMNKLFGGIEHSIVHLTGDEPHTG